MKKMHPHVVFFLLMITLLGLLNLFNFNKPTVSALEHRALMKKPDLNMQDLLSGDYFRNMEDYYSDTFIFRDLLVQASREIKRAFSLLDPGVSLIADYEEPPVPSEPEEELPPPEDIKPPEENPLLPEMEDGDELNVGYWLVVDGKAVQLFKFKKEDFDYYALVLNEYRERLGKDVEIYSLIAPSNSEFVQLRRYEGVTDSQNQALQYLNGRLKPGVQSVNVYDVLKDHTDEYIYFRTDHHWTALGAYYGYCALMESRGERPIPLGQYRQVDLEGFLGSSYSKTLDKSLRENPDTISVYMPFTEHEFTVYYGEEGKKSAVIDLEYAESEIDKYLVFISSGGGTWSVIKTDVRNGRRILVVKDSFGNALVPFLLPHYEEIYIVDSRFYSSAATGKNILEFVEDNRINEVLFLNYMENVNWRQFMEGVQALMD